MPEPLLQQKQKLRDEMRAKRLVLGTTSDASFTALRDNFISAISLDKNQIISSYCAFRNEMGPALLVEYLRAAGHRIALPVTGDKGTALTFRLHTADEPLIPNKMGILEPPASAPVVEPDVLLVPLLAFDAERNRLGYGGGFYDRTIAGLRLQKKILAVGIGYSWQQVEKIPVWENDARLDKIVTEAGTL